MSKEIKISFNKDSKLEFLTPKNNSKNLTLQKIEQKMKKYLNNKYNSQKNLNYQYIGLVMQNLIFNKNSHLVSVFKDYMIIDYVEEFLKRFYKKNESDYKLPQFSLFYKNYLKFFCSPTIKHLYVNNLIHNRCEKKAEFFYNENYKNKKNNNSCSENDIGLCEDSESSEQEEDNENSMALKNSVTNKTFFDEKIRKKIEKYSPINSSMALPESGSKLKKDDSGLLISESNETSLVNIIDDISKKKFASINSKKNNTQTVENKKTKKKINNIMDFMLSDNNIKKNVVIKNNSDKKIKKDKINYENCNNIQQNKLKKLGTQNLKILLNKNNGILKSKSNKKIIKKKGLWNLLNERETKSIKNQENINTNNINNINNFNAKDKILIINHNVNKNTNSSYINLSKKKSVQKIRNKFSPDDKKRNSIKNKRQTYQNNFNNNLTNNSNNTFDKNDLKKKTYNFISLSKNRVKLRDNRNHINQNIIDSLINKIKNNAINSTKKKSLSKPKLSLTKHKNYINITRNANNMNKIGLLSLKNTYINSNNSKQNITNSNKTYKNYSNNDIQPKSNKIKNLKFFNSPSSILDFIKMSKFHHKLKNKNTISSQGINNKSNHIHNVNININNQINIRFNHVKDLTSILGHTKKSKSKKEIISRNKNRSLDYNTINQNLIINSNNYSTFFSNYNRKKDNGIAKNNKIYRFKQKNNMSRNKLSYHIENLISNKDIKSKNHYHYLFNSFKSLNNNSKI